jgi:Pyruvate phosphate dikinase, AMP/ATP-binding domain
MSPLAARGMLPVVVEKTLAQRNKVDAFRTVTEFSRADVAYAGGKGANLGELTRAGLPVPPGFVVGATAYAEAARYPTDGPGPG